MNSLASFTDESNGDRDAVPQEYDHQRQYHQHHGDYN